MLNYYEILGVPQNADTGMIRNAYKQKALEWHPDKNPGNAHAEEKFKLINEAYQILSDPVARSRFDDQWNYSHSPRPTGSQPYTRSGPRQPYHYQPPAKRRPTRYKIDKEYHKVNRIVLMIFFGLLASAYALSEINDFMDRRQKEAQLALNQHRMDSVLTMFQEKRYEDALSGMDKLISLNASYYTFLDLRDSMLTVLRDQALVSYQAENYTKATEMYAIIYKHEWRKRISTLEYYTMSMVKSGDHSSFVPLLEAKLKEDPDDLSILYQISTIYVNELGESSKAAPYLTRAIAVFKDSYTKMYGSAFEMVAKPEHIPEIYFDIFNLRSKVNITLKDYSEAYTDCNWAVFIRPDRRGPYERRILTGIESGETARICRDLNKLASLGGEVDNTLVSRYCN